MSNKILVQIHNIKNILTSALTKKQYAPYYHIWKGDLRNNDWSNGNPTFGEYKEDYINKNGEILSKYLKQDINEVDFTNIAKSSIDINEYMDIDSYNKDVDKAIKEGYNPKYIDKEDYFDKDTWIDDLHKKIKELKSEYKINWWKNLPKYVLNIIKDDYKKEYPEIREEQYFDLVNDKVQHIYEPLFNGKYRIYLNIPITISFENLKYIYFSLHIYFVRNLIKSYLLTTKKISHEELDDKLNEWGYNDFKNILKTKTVKMPDGRNISFKKLYSSSREDFLKEFDLTKEIYNDFINFLNIDLNGNNYLIVISRHPYDLAGISTDRRHWKSCMNIINGQYKEHVFANIVQGALVAYIINKDDKNINDPLGRLLIKPFVKTDDKGFCEEMNWDINNPNWILMASRVYGNNIIDNEKFIETVQDWLDENWNDMYGDENFVYSINRNLYEEESRTNIRPKKK